MKMLPELSDAEWELVVELLERERKELPAEVHHTRTSEMRDKLRARIDLVEGLLKRLERQSAA